jgi:two-component system chemotaxis response regulator CheY
MAGLKVVIADGSAFMRIMLSNALESLGFEVVATAKNAQEAVDKYSELKPDIMFLDMEMADKDNFAAVRAIADDPSAAIILMIPERLDIPDLIVDAVKAGAKGFIRKPISPTELKARIEGALRR